MTGSIGNCESGAKHEKCAGYRWNREHRRKRKRSESELMNSGEKMRRLNLDSRTHEQPTTDYTDVTDERKGGRGRGWI
jgi:hypothetical protein